jgi:hypothetical protein
MNRVLRFVDAFRRFGTAAWHTGFSDRVGASQARQRSRALDVFSAKARQE